MNTDRRRRVLDSYQAFFADEPVCGPTDVITLFRAVADSVPAYREFLAGHGVDVGSVGSAADFVRLPTIDKDSYLRAYPLPDRCRDGRLDSCDVVAVSSGSGGAPTIWPRSLTDELQAARRFEQVFRDGFRAADRTTLAVVCFPMGTWVGGLFTTACTRHLAAKGFPITVVAPGNDKAEILRVLPELAPHVDQVVLLGYPPFVKDVIDTGVARGVDWAAHHLKLVLAGEVFSEEWRDLVAHRGGIVDPVRDIASLYGTADAGVLANETPLSVAVRRFLSGRPDLVRELVGESRLPTLLQFDPAHRYFEEQDGLLLLTADSGVPLIRYAVGDEGGVLGHDDLLGFCARHGFDPVAAVGPEVATSATPFVYVFGRSLFTVSLFGANVYPENVTVALEQPGVSDRVTGRFVLEAYEDADRDRRLAVTVELAGAEPGDEAALADTLAAAIRDELVRANSEFAHYVPADRQLPRVVVRPAGDPEYFPIGVKHRYTRRSLSAIATDSAPAGE